MSQNGLFISFEGIDGSGKSTQARLLCDYFSECGYRFMQVRDPGGTDVAEKIRDLLKSGLWHTHRDAMTEFFLHLAARAHLMNAKIVPALAQGYIVIADRFSDSTLAYQGVSTNMDVAELEKIAGLASSAPDLTFLLDISPCIALQRLASNSSCDWWEKEGRELLHQVRQVYLLLGFKYPERIKKLDGAETKQMLHARVLSITRDVLGERELLGADANAR